MLVAASADIQEFQKTFKQFLCEKVTIFPKLSGKFSLKFPKIPLKEIGEINFNNSKVGKSFCNFFENAIPSLNIKRNKHFMPIIVCKIQLKLV